MKRLIDLLIVLVGCLVLTAVAAADDAADIKAAQRAHFAAYNASDADAVAQYVLPKRSHFRGGGQFLSRGI